MNEHRLVKEENQQDTEDVEVDIGFVDETVSELGDSRDALIPILQAMQAHWRYLPERALRHLCEISDITPADVTGVSTFYSQFRHEPVGEHMVSVCHGTACHVKGAELVSEAIRRYLAIDDDVDTTDDRVFTLERVHCLGCCTLAPVVQIDGVTYGHLTPDTVPEMVEDFLRREERAPAEPAGAELQPEADGIGEIRVGVASCCIPSGSLEVKEAMEQAVGEMNVAAVVKPVGCVGMCHNVPLVEVVPPGREPAIYARVQPDDAEAIIKRHFTPRGTIRRVSSAVSGVLDQILTDEAWEPVTRRLLDTDNGGASAFLGPQVHIASELYGSVDPLDLDDYLEQNGFEALRESVTELRPQGIIDTVGQAGLRGRGGAGFPTARKWQLVRDAARAPKYLICNADEGDPGAFMDRMLLESFPFRVLEGMAIAAYALGVREGVLYIRAEYPTAVQTIWDAIEICEERGLLGEAIFDTDFSLQLSIMEGAGAFVCGEETGLIASIEGRRGMPRLRPPFPAERGLWGQPTCVNNVETFACVPWIIRNGSEAFADLGTESSAGTKVFSLAGKVRRGGLIEVPMGITIEGIVEQIGGGVQGGRKLKAVQIGGPSGGCVPAELAHIPVDYEALTGVGAIMGSGGLVVLDETDCMVDVARYFLDFTQRESCGKCTPCRVGTRKMLDILDRLCDGEGKPGDIEELESLANMVKHSSLCGLGQTAPNPVLTTLRYFRDEYEAHIEGTCPAGKCRGLITYRVTDDCIGCTRCAQACPADAIDPAPYQKHEIDEEECIRCGSCKQICPAEAIVVE